MDALSKITKKLVSGSAVLLAVCSLIGLMGKYYWLFDLFAHSRVHYFLAALFLFALSLYFRSRAAIAISCIVIVFNALLIFPVYRGSEVAIAPVDTWKLLSLNVNHDSVPTDTLVRLVQSHQPEVVILSETSHTRVIELSTLLSEYTNVMFGSREGRQNFGVGVLVHDEMDAVLQAEDFSDVDIFGVVGTFTFHGRACTIVGIHMMYPFGYERTRVRDQQLRTVADRAKDSSCFVAIGDMNITPWSPVFGEVLKTGNLKDSRVGFGIQTSWPVWLPAPLRIPIDHALVSEDLRVGQRQVLENVGSDHLPILITVGLPVTN